MMQKNPNRIRFRRLVLIFLGLLIISGTLCSCGFFRKNSNKARDTREVKAFINDAEATERDLEFFDMLRIHFEENYLEQDKMDLNKEDGDGERPKQRDRKQKREEAEAYVDTFREKLAFGTWPQDDSLLPGPEYSSSPQLWVRLAELSQDFIEKETGEKWRVLTLSYPYLDVEWDYIIPIQEERSKEDAIVTSLICESGDDAGIIADVRYYRWADKAYFASDLEEKRNDIKERQDIIAQIKASGVIGERSCSIDGHFKKNVLYVWSSGEDDPWRDPETFSNALVVLSNQMGMEDLELNLVAQDAPVFIKRYEKMEVMPAEDAPNAMLHAVSTTNSFEFAPADLLYSQEIWNGDAEDLGTLRGKLTPGSNDPFYHWQQVVGKVVDEEKESMTGIVAGQLGAEENQVIALPCKDKTGSHQVHVVLSEGILPESPGETEDAIRELQHVLWRHIFTDAYKEDLYTIWLYVYVIDADEITGPGGVADFATLRSAVMKDSSGIELFEAPLLLRAQMSCYAYDSEVDMVEECWVTEYPIEFEGPMAESREWHIALAEEY